MILNKHLKNTISTIFCSAFICLSACNTTTTSENTKKDSTAKKTDNTEQQKNVETLPNSDNSYLGEIGGQPAQINLRKYSKNMSGTYWLLATPEKEVKFEGTLQDNGDIMLNTQDQRMMNAKIKDGKVLIGTIKDEDGKNNKTFLFTLKNFQEVNIKEVQKKEIIKKSVDGERFVEIDYPQVIGYTDFNVGKRVNRLLEDYFRSGTQLQNVDKNTLTYNFKEDVNYELSYMGKDMMSIHKHHHLSKDKATQLFDDSHGININFKRGKVYEIQDLFKPNALFELNNFILKKVEELCKNELAEGDKEKCKLKLDESTSFSMSKDKITFHLTERLPHKYRGCGYLRIQYKDLRPFFHPSGPLAQFIK